ncbi:hypothetical protein AKJ65_01270 [candidate division MSBL1 archaeon SCGC-AAA259E19]|uniref:Pterin-binding domain-containing protein n=1 Tax=candidate division MSBL1 archaeon SCGC-AAA259E19 TaxID=1698264 RepID=A0A133UNB1_9EURY|nr:hypothetical protein AKJ65_01270 [candidate division MSBL1 archaeon SCGC-AAA259E19]
MNKGVILLVTGKRAEELVKKYSAQSEVDTRVRVLPIEIASFMDMDHILSGLKKKDLKESSMILVPGQAGFDLSSAEEEVGVPIFKGPNHAADIPMVLNNLNDLELSKELSASKLLVEKAAELAKKRVHQIKGEAIESAGEDSNFRLGRNKGSIMVGKDFPPRIVGEIVNAPNLTAEELIDRTSRYLKEGADIIDIGMKAEKSDPEKIRETIRLLRENFNVPLSIDTTDESEIKAALEEGIDMIVSIDGSTIEEFGGLDIPAVIIPRNQDTNYFPEDQKEKLDYLLKLLKRAKKLEYERPIADPLLRPVGKDFADSESQLLFDVAVFRCRNCGNKLLSLSEEKPAKCPNCAKENLAVVVKEGVQGFPFDVLDMAEALDLEEIWDSCPEKSREMVAETYLDDSKFSGGALISVFAGLLCKAAGGKPKPGQIERVVRDEEYRERLLEKVSSPPLSAGHKLSGRQWMSEIATAFWD